MQLGPGCPYRTWFASFRRTRHVLLVVVSLHSGAGRRAPLHLEVQRPPQLTAFFTSAPILASSAAVNSFRAKATGHRVPSSRFALSLKPNVGYLALNLCALWKKQTTLPSLAYAGIPYQVLGARAGALALMMAWSRSAMARSGFGISAIFTSTSLSPSAFFARGPRRTSAFSSWARSFIAARSSSVNPLPALLVTVALFADFCVSVFGLMEPPHTDFGWTPRRSTNADPRYSDMRRPAALRLNSKCSRPHRVRASTSRRAVFRT